MLFGKKQNADGGAAIDAIIDAMDSDVVIVRNGCELVAGNRLARERMEREGIKDFLSCKTGYSSMFVNLCDQCPIGRRESGGPFLRDLQDDAGRLYSLSAGPVPWPDKLPAACLSLRDVDAQRDIEQKLYRLAYVDQLTNVFNRQKLREDFKSAASKLGEGDLRCVMALFDMDYFKTVNDTYGHNTGDAMLKRLTSYFRGEEAYASHLYRLGGDEFVLFYTDLPGHLRTEEDYRKYCARLFKNVFFSYTMPNIDVSCTISMGVSFAPFHGASYSELLRKADIALYQAKEAGRNRLVFFEEQYDGAKKFEDYYINIQPLLTGAGKTFGYELTDNAQKESSDDTLNLSELNRTIDSLGIGDLNNENKYIIAYSKQLENQSVSKYLPKDKFIIQIGLNGGNGEKALELCKRLRELGYVLALAGLTEENISPALFDQADYFKFAAGNIVDWQVGLIGRHRNKFFIATRVDTVPTLEKAKEAGFKLFQGNFFNQPVVVKKEKDIDPIKANYYRLLTLTGTNDPVNFAQIANVISSDVALSYKLLRLLNSAAIGLKNRMTSIQMAVSYLGEETLKKWIALLALRGVASDKPLELVRMSLIRARFGELLAPHFKQRFDPNQVFMAGMFSLLHIALEKTQEELLQEIAVSEDIRQSLLTSEGIYSDLISFFNHYEYSNWDEVSRFADLQGLTSECIYNAYIEAVKWYGDLVQE